MKKFNPDDKIVSTLKSDEGFSRYPYLCTSGYFSVGYGRNLSANGISRDEAHDLLMNDLQDALDLTLTKIPVSNKLSENRLCVLVMMVFNMGVYKVLRFKKMLAALKKGDYNEAASEMLNSAWARQVKGRAHRLAEAMITDKL